MERHPGGGSATRRLLAASGLVPPCRIIDLGAGDGDSVRLLRSLGFEADGVDIIPGKDVQYGDIFSALPARGQYEAALSQCVFFMSGDAPRALASAHRLLKSGGVLLYSDIIPGGESALRTLAGGAGFDVEHAEDITREWREYYIAALWQGEAAPPPEGVSGKDCRYLEAVLRKRAPSAAPAEPHCAAKTSDMTGGT